MRSSSIRLSISEMVSKGILSHSNFSKSLKSKILRSYAWVSSLALYSTPKIRAAALISFNYHSSNFYRPLSCTYSFSNYAFGILPCASIIRLGWYWSTARDMHPALLNFGLVRFIPVYRYCRYWSVRFSIDFWPTSEPESRRSPIDPLTSLSTNSRSN